MLTTFRTQLNRWFSRNRPPPISGKEKTEEIASSIDALELAHSDEYLSTHAAPYDENLLDRARLQWQVGEWETLALLDLNTLEHHPDRAKLALVVASAWQQLNDHDAARRFAKLAKEWGCDKKVMASVLVAGVHNTLGKRNGSDPFIVCKLAYENRQSILQRV